MSPSKSLRILATVSVLGANSGGRAIAADLALQGLAVRLFDWADQSTAIAPLLQDPLLRAAGEVSGTARLELVTTDLAAALDRTDLVIGCLPGSTQPRLARELAPLLWDGALVVLNPGATGGALRVRQTLSELHTDRYVVLAETTVPTHVAHITGPRTVYVAARGRQVRLAALPAAATPSLLAHLRPFLPGLLAARDVLEVALSNPAPVLRPAAMLADLPGADGLCPGPCGDLQERLMAAVDAERRAVGAALGYDLAPTFGSPCAAAPDALDEDVGLGLVTYISLGEVLGVPTPVCRGLAMLAATVTGRDYLRAAQRVAAGLGLGDVSDADRRALLHEPRRLGRHRAGPG